MDIGGLSPFEASGYWVKPMCQYFRRINTVFDWEFYDVPMLVAALRERGKGIATDAEAEFGRAIAQVDLTALDNPEGSLLVVDAARPPYVRSFLKFGEFLDWLNRSGSTIDTITVAGVGSSALGSAALAWNVSIAIGGPVVGIVAGYGVADVVLQGLGGWFGFGLHDFLQTKSQVQTMLAGVLPQAAGVGRELAASVPESARAASGAPVFRHGSGSSDVLHALLKRMRIRRLVGHSKGALVIANALRSLEAEHTRGLNVVTLGCTIAREVPGVSYHQFLGAFDGLGRANSWGNEPDQWTLTEHTTNTVMPLSMHAADLAAERASG